MSGFLPRVLAGVALLVAWGCAAAGPGGEEETLLASVQATPGPDGVYLVLQVTNASEEPVELEYATGQSFDFAVSAGGREVWRWSADRMFTQALRSVRLAAGETVAYEATWSPPPGASGEYTVVGTLTTRDRPVQQAARFRLP